MNRDPSTRDPLGEIADAFVERYRRGERPSIDEYAEQYPELADEIRDVFPALTMLEEFRPPSEDSAGALDRVETDADFKPLERLGDYRILREVGRGGMGIVYEAEQESLGRHVAVKVLCGHALLDRKHLRRFRREARAAAQLHHTNVVPIYGVGEDSGVHYFVMQYISGQGLDRVIAELRRLRSGGGGPTAEAEADRRAEHGEFSAADAARSLLTDHFHQEHLGAANDSSAGAGTDQEQEADISSDPARQSSAAAEESRVSAGKRNSGSSLASRLGPAELGPPELGPSGQWLRSESLRRYWRSVARIGHQVADALDYVHAQDTIHRDIKPSNLLLDMQGVVWITDLGLAKSIEQDNLTQSGDVVGTLRYMAPESLGGRADARSDLFALGLTLYELVALRPARDAADRISLIRQLTRREAPRLGKLNPQVPRDLATIIHKAIESDPERRYRTAGEMAADLKRFLTDEPIKARHISRLERLWRWSKHHPAVAGLTVVVALLLLLLAIGSTVTAVRFEQLAKEKGRAALQETLAKREAEQATKEAKAIADFLLNDIIAANKPQQAPGQEIITQEVLDQAAANVDHALAGQPRTKVRVYSAIAQAYQSLGLYQKAEQQWTKALELERSLHKPQDESVLTALENLAELLQAQMKHRQAVPLLRTLLSGCKDRFGQTHHQVANAMVRLGWSLGEVGETQEGEALVRRGLKMYRETLPEDHWRIADAESTLGGLLSAGGHHAEAEPLLLSGYATLASAPVATDFAGAALPYRIPQALRRIVQLYEAWSKPEKAARWRGKLTATDGGGNPSENN